MAFAIIQSMLSPNNNDTAAQPQQRLRLRDFLFIPLGCLFRSPLLLLLAAVSIGLFSWFVYTNFNWDVLGLAAPEYQNWEVSPGFSMVKNASGTTWKITYEANSSTTFTGLVRHITPIRSFAFPLLTHDILVTRGDYADQDIVSTSVSNHHFSWTARGANSLSGSINLLHTVPENEEIFHILLKVRKGDWIRIVGREILSIESLNNNGDLTATWKDSGCNSILVTKVEIIEPPE